MPRFATPKVLNLGLPEGVVALLWQDQLKAMKVVRQGPQQTAAAKIFAQTLRKEGRGFYVGSGTSGRLGVLDAVELPPVFSIKSARLRAVMAGGEQAFSQAREEREDNKWAK